MTQLMSNETGVMSYEALMAEATRRTRAEEVAAQASIEAIRAKFKANNFSEIIEEAINNLPADPKANYKFKTARYLAENRENLISWILSLFRGTDETILASSVVTGLIHSTSLPNHLGSEWNVDGLYKHLWPSDKREVIIKDPQSISKFIDTLIGKLVGLEEDVEKVIAIELRGRETKFTKPNLEGFPQISESLQIIILSLVCRIKIKGMIEKGQTLEEKATAASHLAVRLFGKKEDSDRDSASIFKEGYNSLLYLMKAYEEGGFLKKWGIKRWLRKKETNQNVVTLYEGLQFCSTLYEEGKVYSQSEIEAEQHRGRLLMHLANVYIEQLQTFFTKIENTLNQRKIGLKLGTQQQIQELAVRINELGIGEPSLQALEELASMQEALREAGECVSD